MKHALLTVHSNTVKLAVIVSLGIYLKSRLNLNMKATIVAYLLILKSRDIIT